MRGITAASPLPVTCLHSRRQSAGERLRLHSRRWLPEELGERHLRTDAGRVRAAGFQALDVEGRVTPLEAIDWDRLPGEGLPYRLRQAPGGSNPLGLLKIIFPNPLSIYLHDTPQTELFRSSRRAFSSGCVRVDEILTLAGWLLEETDGWDAHRIRAAVAGGEQPRVDLRTPIPVHLLYFTVEVLPDGRLRYLEDIYQRDRDVLRLLDGQPTS
jgi:murein L,D-transpeptidase YcbB/YkuD